MLLICLGIFACALYYEYLKYLYNDALYTLNFLLDPQSAEEKYKNYANLISPIIMKKIQGFLR